MSPKPDGLHLVVLVLCASLYSGCQTTTKESSDYNIGDAKSSSILDSRLKKLGQEIELYPNRHDLLYKQAAIYFQQEAYRESATALTRAIDLAPDESKYHYHLGRVYLRSGDMGPAETQFREAVRLMPPDRYTGPYAALGYVLGKKKDVDGAIEQFKKCTEIEAQNPMYYYFLGSLYDMLLNPAETIHFYQEYLTRGGKRYRRKAVLTLERLGVKVASEEADGPRLGAPEGAEDLRGAILGPGKENAKEGPGF